MHLLALLMKRPRSIHEVLKIPEWRKEVLEDVNVLEKNETWVVTKLPIEKKVVSCKWIFTVKYNSDGSVSRFKAQMVARGFTQSYGIDYQEMFAHIAKLNTVRVLLCMASNLYWPLYIYIYIYIYFLSIKSSI